MYTPPILPAQLSGTLWGVSAYFNPAGYKSRLHNFRVFRDRLHLQGVPLIVAEAAFGDAPFEVADDDADLVLRFRTTSILWQKERLLNLARSGLPADCDKVVCLDGDVCFLRNDWPAALSAELEKYVIVQPYREVAHPPQGYVPDPGLTSVSGLPGERGFSTGYSCAFFENDVVQNLSGHPGYAMAARRKELDTCGYYERMILGGGDSLFLGACYGMHLDRNTYLAEQKGGIGAHSAPWCDRVSALVQGSVGSLEGDILHLWHGDRNRRFYGQRKILLEHFDPATDVVAQEGGCIEWAPETNPTMKEDVAGYFFVRNEDGAEIPHGTKRVTLSERLIAEREMRV